MAVVADPVIVHVIVVAEPFFISVKASVSEPVGAVTTLAYRAVALQALPMREAAVVSVLPTVASCSPK